MKWLPDRKVWAGGLFGVFTWFLFGAIADQFNWVMTTDQQMTYTILLQFVFQYLVPPALKDKIRVLDDDLKKQMGLQDTPPATFLGFVLALILVPMLLSACTSVPNAQTQLLLACQSYTDALHTLEPFKPKMTDAQLVVIRESIRLADPICNGDGDLGTTRGALDLVRGKLRELVILENQVKT